jgi:hypothetical protein
METYIDWRLSSVLSLLALVCLSICCFISFLKLIQLVAIGMVAANISSTALPWFFTVLLVFLGHLGIEAS